MKLSFAPLEGITSYIYRNTHAEYFGGCDEYYTPFISPSDNSKIGRKGFKDMLPENNRIVKPMFASPFDATKIADEYFKTYNDADRENVLQDYGVLLSVVDCDLLEELASVTAEMIIKYADKESALDMRDIQRYCPKPTTSRPNFYDMNAYMMLLITDEADYQRWHKALDRTMSYAAATPWWFSIYSNQGREMVDLDVYSGISCYVPQSEDSYTELNALFRTTSWYTAAGWQQVGW